MGVARAGNLETVGQSNAQVVGGSLRFDKAKSQYLKRTPTNDGNRKTWTWSGWIKLTDSGVWGTLFRAGNSTSNPVTQLYFYESRLELITYNSAVTARIETSQLFRDPSAWYHIVCAVDTTQSTGSNKEKIYINGVLVTNFNQEVRSGSAYDTFINSTSYEHDISFTTQIGNTNAKYFDGLMSNVYFIDGQQLDPSYFGYTDPLTNTWRPKKLSSSIAFGTNGFYLPFDGNSPIGQDQSGRGNNWTPVNFGGSNTIEKATGALPILNTDGGGKVARVGVRTDSNASSLVLALPLVGIKSDFSNAINSGTSNKAVTVNGDAAASSAQSNFYGGSFAFDGTGDYLSIPDSADFAFGSGDFTIESWVYINNLSSTRTISGQNNSGGGGSSYGHFLEILSDGSVNAGGFEPGVNYINVTTPTGRVTTGKWHHIAMVRNGNNLILYVDGINQASLDITGKSFTDSSNLFAIGRPGEYNGYYMNGYIQDYRLYKGVAKYTQNFIPASTDPDILPDTPSGVAYSSNVALVPSTDGAVAFDNNGDYLSLASSSDFALGTNDWTIEWFAYPTSNAQYQRPFYLQGGNVNTIDGVYTDGTGIAFGRTNVWASSAATNPLNRWNHYALVHDSTNMRLYINGVQVLTDSNNFGTDASKSLNIAYSNSTFGGYFAGQISNFHIVKDQALYTSNFTPPTGPISSVANTKLLCCKSQTSATAADVTPGTITANGNAAATNFNPFTVNINTQRGQESGYATWNPLKTGSDMTLSNGNLQATGSSANPSTLGTIGMSSGKWYWEITVAVFANMQIGIGNDAHTVNSYLGGTANSWSMHSNGNKYTNGSSSSYGSSYTTGDVIGVAFDADNGTLTFYKNNISQGIAFSSLTSGPYFPGFSYSDPGSVIQANFGQKPFKFPPPAGFQPLALSNTPRPTIVRPDQYVGIVTYTGTTANPVSIKSTNFTFTPDFVWVKSRSNAESHALYDTVRGATYRLRSDTTGAETTGANELQSFIPGGFTAGNNGHIYYDGYTYVAWCWKAGGNSNTFNINDIGYSTASAAGLTAGTITPTGASVNTKSGFSIIAYTGTGSAGSVPHGLGKEPYMIILKTRGVVDDWRVYHKFLDSVEPEDYYLMLQSTNGRSADQGASFMNDTAPTSTTFSLGTDSAINGNTRTMIAYCWAEIPGFSKFGKYTGNASTDGTVVVTGFRPRWVLIKRTDATATNWMLRDSTRSTYNVINTTLAPNVTTAESGIGDIPIDFLSNGFKLRDASSVQNANGVTYIYAAFAETPSFNLYGGQSNAR